MAIDYQKILSEMNRPVVRKSHWGRNLALALAVCALGAGGWAIWHYGLVSAAWESATNSASVILSRTDDTAFAASPTTSARQEDKTAALHQLVTDKVEPVMQPVAAEAPAAVASVPQPQAPKPTDTGVIPISEISVSSMSDPVPAVPVSPVRQPSPVLEQAVSPVPADATPAPAPVLSEFREQLRAIDQILSSNPQEAMRRVEALLASALTPEEQAEVGYRLGYAARMLRDEEKAEAAWKETAQKYPTLRGGRFSAFALADTWYKKFAVERPQVSTWEDITILYSQVLGMDDAPFLPENVKNTIKANLKNLNDSVLFGSGPCSFAVYHTIQQGELLGSIANKYRTDYESIARINGINPNRIRAGMNLKVIPGGEVVIIVRKNTTDPNHTPTVTWFINGRWAREYPACVGETLKTPGGNYEVASKERDPSWTNPANGQLLPNAHPENILGSRWMAIKGMGTTGLGIHGTTVDDSIPGYSSAGCVRLHNKDVEELFSFTRIGSRVTIIE